MRDDNGVAQLWLISPQEASPAVKRIMRPAYSQRLTGIRRVWLTGAGKSIRLLRRTKWGGSTS